VLLWMMVALLFYCRQLERREAAELEEIAQRAATGTIFEKGAAEQRPAAARLAWIERWLTPLFTLLFAGYQAAIGLLVLRHLLSRQAAPMEHVIHGVLFSVLMGFFGFLYSRYCTGMSHQLEWRPLRASGSYLLVNVLFMASVAVACGAAYQGYEQVDRVIAYIITLGQIVLAIELLLNFILELYRPRLSGQEERPSYDSRLLNLIAEPGRVGHSLAETLNYQFGFEVSKTWFYQLLSRALVPLIVFGVLVLAGLTSVVIVNDGEQGVVLHWGRYADQAVLGPGMHFKWPWPIDSARRYDVSRPQEIVLGAGKETAPGGFKKTIIEEGVFKG
jgi:hypothetical protein